MKILLIGTTGYIGKAVAKRFVADGHHVVGVTRQQASVNSLSEAGIEPLLAPGGFADVDSISRVASTCDAVVDTAAHDFSNLPPLLEFMLKIRSALGPGKVLISTTGAFFYGDVPESKVKPVSEDSPFGFFYSAIAPAWTSFEASVLEAGSDGVLTCVLRPVRVYGNGGFGIGGGIVAKMEWAVKNGASVYIDDGRGGGFSDIHVDDLADLYAFVLGALQSQGLPTGSIVNASSSTSTHKELAEAISAACDVPAMAMKSEEATSKVDPFTIWKETLVLFVDNQKACSLGWKPSRPSLVDDLTAGSYKGLKLGSKM